MKLNQGQMDAAVDFVHQAYQQVETNVATDGQLQQFEEQREQVTRELSSEIETARKENNPERAQLLKQLRATLLAQRPGEAVDPKTLKLFEQLAAKLGQQDGFGQQGPKGAQEALAFLKTLQGGAGKAPGKTETSKGEAPAAKESARGEAAAKGQGAESPKGPQTERRQTPPPDPRIREFVEQFWGDGFEKKGSFSEKEILAALPKEQQEAFKRLSPEDRKFLLTLSDAHQNLYGQMNAKDQKFFRGLKESERNQFFSMTPDERVFFQSLKPDERASYLTLHPDQRERLRQMGAEGQKALGGAEQFKELLGKNPAEFGKQFGAKVLEVLGHALGAGEKPTPAQAELLEKATSLSLNLLQQNPGNFAMAKVATLKALLKNPEFSEKILGMLSQRLAQRDSARDASGTNQSYLSHFRMIRGNVLDYAERMLNPGSTMEELLGGMEKAVELSAEFAIANPPRRRALRAARQHAFSGKRIVG